jgi:hypothetical protein
MNTYTTRNIFVQNQRLNIGGFDMVDISSNLSILNSDVSQNTADIAELQIDVANHTSQISTAQLDISNLKYKVGLLQTVVNDLLTFTHLSFSSPPSLMNGPDSPPINLASWDPTKQSQIVSVFNDGSAIFYIPQQRYNDNNYVLSFTSSASTLSLSAKILTGPAQITFNGDGDWILTNPNVGLSTIIVYNNGDENYNPILTSYSFQTLQAFQTLTFTPSSFSKQYTDGSFAFDVSSSSGLPVSTVASSDSSVVSITGSAPHYTATINAAGTATIFATQTGNSLYLPVDASVNVVVAKSIQTISGIPFSHTFTYQDSSYNLALQTTASALNNAITLSSSDPSVLAVSGTSPNFVLATKKAGTTLLTASQSGNGNYFAAPDRTYSVTVNPFKPVLSISGGYSSFTKTYRTDTSFNVIVKSTANTYNGIVPPDISFSSSNTSVATVAKISSTANSATFKVNILAAGSSTLTATQPALANYYSAATNLNTNLTVNRASHSLTGMAATYTKTRGATFDISLSDTAGDLGVITLVDQSENRATINGPVHIGNAYKYTVILPSSYSSRTLVATSASNSNYTDVTASTVISISGGGD